MTTSSRPNWALALGLPLLVIIICTIIVFSPLFAQNISRMSTAVILDLTVTAPLLYFLAIRKSNVSKMSVTRVFVVGVLVAGLLLSGRNPLLHGIKTWLSPVIEGLVILTIVLKFYTARKKVHQLDFLSRARAIAGDITGSPKAGDILGSEIAVLYYALAGRKAATGFSYTHTSGAIPILAVFMMAMLAEAIGLHFLIARWSAMAAWIFSGLSAYTMLQLFAHMRAMKARPIRVEGRLLHLCNGLAADVCIHVNDIEEITRTTRMIKGEKALKLALFGALEGHNLRIQLRQPVTVVRMFGIRRQTSVLLFGVDKPEEFLQCLGASL